MLSVSNAWKNEVYANHSRTYVKATLTLANGNVYYLDSEATTNTGGLGSGKLGTMVLGTSGSNSSNSLDYSFVSATFSDAITDTSSFSIGNAIMNSFSFALNNRNRVFDGLKIKNATITPYVGIKLSSGSIEWIRKPTYIVNGDARGNILSLVAYDYMCLTEKAFDDIVLTYPITLGSLASRICSHCGVTLASSTFTNSNFQIESKPIAEGLSCRQVLGYIAEIAGCNATIKNDNKLYFLSFDSNIRNTSYTVPVYKRLTVGLEDMAITGVSVKSWMTEEYKADEDPYETKVNGTLEYAIYIENNPLIAYGEAGYVANTLGTKLNGLKFRTVDIDTFTDPAIEVGDTAKVTDDRGETFYFYCNNVSYSIASGSSIVCAAHTEDENSLGQFANSSQAIVNQLAGLNKDLNDAIHKEITDREQAVLNLNQTLSNAQGFYETTATDESGASIAYIHNRKELSDSNIVWKITSEAIGVSTDGGETYPYGLQVNGDAILNYIYANKISADYINIGDNALMEYLDNIIKVQSKIQSTLEEITLQVQQESSRKEISTSSSSLHNWETSEAPTLYNYPTDPEFFLWRACSSNLYCSDTLTCGEYQFTSHIGEIAKDITSNYYYIFENDASVGFRWRKLSTSEVSLMSDISSSVRVMTDGVYLSSSENENECTLTVKSDGVRASALYCC